MTCQKCEDTGTIFEVRMVSDEYRGYGLIDDVYDRWCDCETALAQQAKKEEKESNDDDINF